MADERFDAIIVGGGLAGLTAAYLLAGQGLETLLVDKGNYSGAKNMTGGRLYAHSLEKVIPGFADTAPVERRVVRERLTTAGGTTEYESSALCAPEGESYTVLRGKFDKWLSEQAEEQGAMLVYGIRVDDLILREGKVCGVIAGDEEMEADVVILADSVNSLLGQKLGHKQPLGQDQAAVGVKELIELGEDTVNRRFGVNSGEGVAWMFDGSEDACGGFLYTNKDSVSVGITLTVGDIRKTENSVPQLLEDFKNRPDVAPLLEGGRLIEYSAHLIPEGGGDMIPKLYGDGVLLVGDAAALCANLGFTLRGMDLAVESGRLAANTVIAAKQKGDFSAEALAGYQKALEESFVLPCVRGAETCRGAVEAGGFQGDPAKTFNEAMQSAKILG
jgi:electron transfer flavoprotein-quinone oxidoreductase